MSTADAPTDPTAATVEVVVGRVARAHGLRGDVVVDVRTDEPARRFATGARFQSPRGGLTVASTHWHGTRLLVHFDEVADRDAAEALRGVELRLDVPAAERPADPEEFYDHQLVGLVAVDLQGEVTGHVTEVVHLPAQDVLTVRRPDGSDTLVPFVRELVPTVDLLAGKLTLAQLADALPAGATTSAPQPSAPDEPEQP